MAQIRIENLRKSFDQFTAVEGSTFTIDDGTFFAMLGPSGCGKTTTLRMIAGLELPTEGKILLDGEDVTFHRAAARDIAFVFQLFALYPHMNVGENIGFPLKCQGMARREIRERVQETARMLRIEHLLSSKTSKLSGGDRQRVALGRAMVRRPKAFLMDEPLGALDAEFRHLMCGELRDLHDRIKATTVYVTHDQLEAMSMADQIAVMNKGRVEQIGTPQEVYDRPASMFVADFIGSPPMNFLRFEGGLTRGSRCRRSARIAPAHHWRSASVRSISASPTLAPCAARCSARNISAPPRSSPSTPPMAGSRRGCPPAHRCGSARPSVLNSTPSGWRCSTSAAALRSRPPARRARAMADVTLRNVTKRFGAVEAVRDLSLTVSDGEFLVLLGPSGAGKTTTLRLITGLESPDAGSVMIDGRDVTHDPPGSRDIAFVFQQYSLYPHLTVYDNLAFPLRSPARRVAEPIIRKRVEQTAELLHIASKLNNRATRLSGGEMQRVAIGRALVRDPSIYLMDEPLSSLDAKLRSELRLELKRIQIELGATILYVTHDQVEAMTMASRIGVIKDGQLLQLGTPREIYESPSSSYVASRLGTPQINFLPARLLSDVAMPQGTETVGIRTEHLQLAARNGGRMVARVHRVEHLGEQNHIHLDYKGETLVTLADPHQPLQAGQEVDLQLVHPLCFDRAGQRIAAAVH
jgi:multiple sugar transport system ATP-binding protein